MGDSLACQQQTHPHLISFPNSQFKSISPSLSFASRASCGRVLVKIHQHRSDIFNASTVWVLPDGTMPL
uniref:Uncharacterized protein n=1 Tax=Daphnia magna TaxID=35525 RepID=A0A0P6EDY7_9CRUS